MFCSGFNYIALNFPDSSALNTHAWWKALQNGPWSSMFHNTVIQACFIWCVISLFLLLCFITFNSPHFSCCVHLSLCILTFWCLFSFLGCLKQLLCRRYGLTGHENFVRKFPCRIAKFMLDVLGDEDVPIKLNVILGKDVLACRQLVANAYTLVFQVKNVFCTQTAIMCKVFCYFTFPQLFFWAYMNNTFSISLSAVYSAWNMLLVA